MTIRSDVVAVCAAVFTAGSPSWSQPSDVATMKLRLALERALVTEQLDVKVGLTGPPVVGRPYSGRIVTESLQTLADGTQIRHESTFNIYRDSQGRLRRESAGGSEALIHDPVANASYMINTKRGNARRIALAQRHPRRPNRYEARDTAPIEILPEATAGTSQPQGLLEAFSKDVKDLKEEELGTRSIEGLPAKGTRRTVTIPTGMVGNDRPMQIVNERWYSPDLQITLMSRHSDPRRGVDTYRTISLKRGDPPPSLFQIPAGYEVKDGEN